MNTSFEQMRNSLSSRMLDRRTPIEEHDHYVALIFDPQSRKVSKRASHALNKHKHMILSQAEVGFIDVIERVMLRDLTEELSDAEQTLSDQHDAVYQRSGTGNVSRKRKYADLSEQTIGEGLEDSDRLPRRPLPTATRTISPGDTDEWSEWFAQAFRAVQQVSCRHIAKEWIKLIHPKKQSTHPYNGKNPRTGRPGSPSDTKPPYWPHDVIHKEPDHINKEQRTKLLVRFAMNTPHEIMAVPEERYPRRQLKAEDLLQALAQKAQDRSMNELYYNFNLIEDIFKTRGRLEEYNDGCPGRCCEMEVTDYREDERFMKNKDEESADLPVLDDVENDVGTNAERVANVNDSSRVGDQMDIDENSSFNSRARPQVERPTPSKRARKSKSVPQPNYMGELRTGNQHVLVDQMPAYQSRHGSIPYSCSAMSTGYQNVPLTHAQPFPLNPWTAENSMMDPPGNYMSYNVYPQSSMDQGVMMQQQSMIAQQNLHRLAQAQAQCQQPLYAEMKYDGAIGCVNNIHNIPYGMGQATDGNGIMSMAFSHESMQRAFDNPSTA